MVAERGDTPPPKRSRGNRDRSCLGDRDHGGRRNRDDAKKNEDNFKCSVEWQRVTDPLRTYGNSYRAVVEMQKPGCTTRVWMTCVWKGDKLSAERDAERLSCAWKRVAFPR